MLRGISKVSRVLWSSIGCPRWNANVPVFERSNTCGPASHILKHGRLELDIRGWAFRAFKWRSPEAPTRGQMKGNRSGAAKSQLHDRWPWSRREPSSASTLSSKVTNFEQHDYDDIKHGSHENPQRQKKSKPNLTSIGFQISRFHVPCCNTRLSLVIPGSG